MSKTPVLLLSLQHGTCMLLKEAPAKALVTIWAHHEHFIGTTNSWWFERTLATSPLQIPLCRGEGLTSSPIVPAAKAFSEQLGRPTALTLLMHMYSITSPASYICFCGLFSPLFPRRLQKKSAGGGERHTQGSHLELSFFLKIALVQNRICSGDNHKGWVLHRPPEVKCSLK